VRRYAFLAVCLLLAACNSDGGSKPASGPDPFADGGRPAFEAFVKKQQGTPVVVNKWASWCGPCRSEFPFFQRLSVREGRRIAFLGVDANDNDAAARRFLRELPVSYPSYKDPNLKVSAVFNGVAAFPTTAFYDRRGRLSFLHQGAYATESKLARDIARYAR
jgi:cytochrome c biogenesis protein CcmG, thiol:disulfide interchange protein DsbE